MAMLALGMAIWWYIQPAPQLMPAQQEAVSEVQGSDQPSVEPPKPGEFEAHQVAAEQPRYIFIPKLAVKAIVKPLGLTADGAIDSPQNIHHAGWYNESALPGQPGAVVVDGHISSLGGGGVFQNLGQLNHGDEITIQRGDGAILNYRVVKSQTYPVETVDMQAALRPVTPGTPGLNLITCTGGRIAGTDDFNQRLVVFAEAAE